MSDNPHRDDELVSAYLDNEATAAEVAAVEQDDALRARAATLSAVRDAVAAPVTPPAGRRDQIIGAAMAAANEHADQATGAVVSLRRARPALLAVAAAVIVVAAVAGAGLLGSRLGDDEYADVALEAPASFDAGDARAMADEVEPAADEESADDAGTDDPADSDADADDVEPMEMADTDTDDEDMAEGEAAAASTTVAVVEDALALEPDEGEPEPAAPADGTDESAARAVDLGALDDIDAFIDALAARLPESDRADDAPAPPGACSAAVNDYLEGRDDEPLEAFVAMLDAPPRTAVDAVLARRGDDGTTIVVYALAPDCAPEARSLYGDTTP